MIVVRQLDTVKSGRDILSGSTMLIGHDWTRPFGSGDRRQSGILSAGQQNSKGLLGRPGTVSAKGQGQAESLSSVKMQLAGVNAGSPPTLDA